MTFKIELNLSDDELYNLTSALDETDAGPIDEGWFSDTRKSLKSKLDEAILKGIHIPDDLDGLGNI